MIILFLAVPVSLAKNCSSPGMPGNCVEVWPGQDLAGYEYYDSHKVYFFRDLSNADHYFLLMGNITCDSTCTVFGFPDANPDDEYVTTFDLNGYTMEYSGANYESLPNNGFENWTGDDPDNWTVVSGSVVPRNTSYWQPMSGDWVLYTDGAVSLRSSTITLPVARAYRAYVTMGRAASTDITLTVYDSTDTAVCTNTVEGFFRGQSMSCRFDTDSPDDYYVTLTTEDYAYFDKVGVVPLGDYGVGVFTGWSISDSNMYQDPIAQNLDGLNIPTTGDTASPTIMNYIEVKNGNIIAANENQESFGLRTRGMCRSIVHNVTIKGDGLKSHTLSTSGEIYNNTLIVDMPWYFARENSDEENVILRGGSFVNNTAIGGQGVIRLGGSGTIIAGNYLRNNAQATNHYAIIHSGATNPQIYGNTFDPIEGSGILTYVGHGYNIYNNHFNIKTATCNVEYINEDYSTNGIRLNDYGAATNYNNWIYNNTFNITGTDYDTAWSNCMPVTTGIFYSAYGVNNSIFNNSFTVVKDNNNDQAPCFAIYAGGADNNPDTNQLFRNNRFRTNDKAVWISSYYGTTHDMWFENNTFEKLQNEYYTPTMEESAIRIGYYNAWADGIHMVNNQFVGFDEDAYLFTGTSSSAVYNITKKWYLHVNVTHGLGVPAEGALVRATSLVVDDMSQAYTDSGGQAILRLTEYVEEGDTRSGGIHNRNNRSTYSLYVEYNDTVETVSSIDMVEEKHVNIQLGGSCVEGTPDRQCGIDTGACAYGTQSCVDGLWGECIGDVGPTNETCNGEDDDCDGDTDEGLGTLTCGQGVCHHTIDFCVGGAEQVCDPFEGQLYEDQIVNCSNGVDEDCDGSDIECGTAFVMGPADGSTGSGMEVFTCNLSDSKGIKTVHLLTNETGLMRIADTIDYVDGTYRFLEAEDFSFDTADWDVCPDDATNVTGNSCEDDRSDGTNIASGIAHAVADDSIASGSVTDMTRDVHLAAGDYAVWGRSFHRNNPSIRTWQVSVESYTSSVFGDLNNGQWAWQQADSGLTVSSAGTKQISIVDAAPDVYWNYPDLVLITDNLTFNPSSDCGDNLAAIGSSYSLGSCGVAVIHENTSFSRDVQGDILWKCMIVDGTGTNVSSATYSYSSGGYPADDDGDGVIDSDEMRGYISGWQSGSVTISELVSALHIWKG